LTELIESGKAANAVKSDEERRLLADQEAEMGTAKELYEEVVLLREKMKSAEENYLRSSLLISQRSTYALIMRGRSNSKPFKIGKGKQ